MLWLVAVFATTLTMPTPIEENVQRHLVNLYVIDTAYLLNFENSLHLRN